MNYNVSNLSYLKCFLELLKLSFPMILGNLGMILIGITDVIIASKYSLNALSAISIANAIVFCIYVIGIGIMTSISIVLANNRGNKKPTKKYFFSTINFSLILAIILNIVTILTIPLVEQVGFEAKLIPYIKEYMFIVSFSYVGMYLYQALKEFLQAHEIINFPNLILIISVILNLIFNLALTFGFGFIPSLGVKGLAISTLLTRTFMGIALFIYCFYFINTRNLKNYNIFQISYIKDLIKIGYPIAFALMLEFLGFNIITILMGKESGVLASLHNILVSIISIAYMVPLSISNAIAIKVSYYNGSNNFIGIKRYSITGVLMSSIFMLLYSVILYFFPKEVISLFSSDELILKLAIPILLIAVIFEVVDGFQVSLSGVLKGLKMTKTVSICVISGYWLFGLPLGFVLCYMYNLSLKGFWIGLAVSFFFIGLIESIIIIRKFRELSSKKS